jgi:hypothetical protein
MRAGVTLGRKRMVARMNCAAVPSGRCQPVLCSQTRAPIRLPSTPAPTLSIVPAPSLFGTAQGNASRWLPKPARRFTSGFEKFADLFHQRLKVLFPDRVL